MRLHFRIGFFFLTLFFVIVFCLLGIWQLQRYHFKQELMAAFETRSHSSPKPFLSVANQGQDLPFQPVFIEGEFDNSKFIYLQNQMHKGQMGYEVLTPVHLPGESRLLLIDRGWLPQEQYKTWSSTQTRVRVTGYIKLLNEHQFILGKNIYSFAFPLIMQKIDFKQIEEMTHESFFPFIVRATSDLHDGLTRDWIVTSMLPVKHLGYSIQWFLLAGVLMIAFFYFCRESIHHER